MHHNTGSTRHNPENLSLEGNRGNRAVKIPMFSEAKSAFRQMERLPAAPPPPKGLSWDTKKLCHLAQLSIQRGFPWDLLRFSVKKNDLQSFMEIDGIWHF